jgi:hypothetical protein
MFTIVVQFKFPRGNECGDYCPRTCMYLSVRLFVAVQCSCFFGLKFPAAPFRHYGIMYSQSAAPNSSCFPSQDLSTAANHFANKACGKFDRCYNLTNYHKLWHVVCCMSYKGFVWSVVSSKKLVCDASFECLYLSANIIEILVVASVLIRSNFGISLSAANS